MICLICNNVEKKIGYHLKKKHDLSFKEYYDQFLKKQKEDICNNKNCVEVTKFVCAAVGYEKAYYRKFCSKKCAGSSETTKQNRKSTNIFKYGVENAAQREDVQKKMKQTMLEKYGVENASRSFGIQKNKKENNLKKYGVAHPHQLKSVQEKCKKTSLERYGVEYPFQDKTVKLKIKDTNIKRYGVENSSKNIIIKNKISKSNKLVAKQALKARRKTNLNKYGYNDILSSPYTQEKIKQTNLENLGVEYPGQSNKVIEKIRDTRLKNFLPKLKKLSCLNNIEILNSYKGCRAVLKCKCLKCNFLFESSSFAIQQNFHKCPNCYPKYKSIAETDISNFIKSLDFKTINNSKAIIPPYELDIYIPDKKIAIEFNGIYWHSEIKGKDKNYHLNKLNLCLEKDIQLIQIFEDEWLFKQDIVKNRLKQILGVSGAKRVHARKCCIESIPNKDKNSFLNKYHIQGQDISSIRLGAFYNEELVAVMTFSRGSIAKGASLKFKHWELNRFCSNSNYRVVGIAGKLLKHFQRNYEWLQIFSYADRRWSVGNLYKILGFLEEHTTPPNYWYVKNNIRIHRYNLRKRKDDPKDIPEWVLRINDGYTRIWDCGVLKFVLNN